MSFVTLCLATIKDSLPLNKEFFAGTLSLFQPKIQTTAMQTHHIPQTQQILKLFIIETNPNPQQSLP